MAFEDPALLRTDTVLTRISVGYANPQFVGDVLFPSVGVNVESGKYMVYDKNESRTVHDDLRAPAANTREIPPMALARDSFRAEEHALKQWVPVEVNAPGNDPGVNAMARAIRRVTNTVLLNRENLIQTMARTVANYATNHAVTLAGTDQWNDYTNSDPIGDLKTAVSQVQFATFFSPNVSILGWQVAAMLEDHPAYLNRMKTTSLASNNALEAVGQLSGIPRLIRAGTVYNTQANAGQTPTYGYMWGKDVVIAYVPDSPGLEEPAYGYEFNYTFDGDVNGADRWFDKDRKAWAARMSRRYDLKFIAVDDVSTGKATGGYLIKAAIA